MLSFNIKYIFLDGDFHSFFMGENSLLMNPKKSFDKKKKSKQTFKPQVKRTSPGQYVKEVRLELKKVDWPSRQEVLVFTSIVIIVVVIFAIYTGLLDFFFQYLLKISTGLKQ